MAQIKFDLIWPPGKNSRSTASLSTPDIGPQSEPDGPRRHDKVSALQAAVAEGCCFGKTGLVDKPGSGISVWKQARQPVVEPGVVTEDRRHRRVSHLLPVTLEDEGL